MDYETQKYTIVKDLERIKKESEQTISIENILKIIEYEYALCYEDFARNNQIAKPQRRSFLKNNAYPQYLICALETINSVEILTKETRELIFSILEITMDEFLESLDQHFEHQDAIINTTT